MSKIKIGDTVRHKGKDRVIVKRIKGELTKKPNMQSGSTFTGYHRKPCKYELDNGDIISGSKIANSKNKPCKATKKESYDFNKPYFAQDLPEEWDDYAWLGTDF